MTKLFEWSLLLVFVKPESTHWNSSGERPYLKILSNYRMQCHSILQSSLIFSVAIKQFQVEEFFFGNICMHCGNSYLILVEMDPNGM